MKKLILFFLIFSLYFSLKAQDIFVVKGKIEFEKKVNIYREIEAVADDDNDWINSFKKSLPQFELTYFNLFFDGSKTLYKPGREVTVDLKVPDWFRGPATDNIIYNDLTAEQTVSQKNVFENTFLIQDSLSKINWRLTPDLRTIAGFECHKAVGRIMDSVYVIAFYTDQILTSGGPESFTGLPGMILGIAIPRINTTWFATKLELINVQPQDLAVPKKGKKVNNNELMKQLQTSLKDWGKHGQRNIWHIMI